VVAVKVAVMAVARRPQQVRPAEEVAVVAQAHYLVTHLAMVVLV